MGDPRRDVQALSTSPSGPSPDRPARFESYPSDIVERAYQVWSTTGRSGARTERLLAREFGAEVAVPSGSTVNRWSTEQGWAARAQGDVLRTRGRSLEQLRSGLLAAVVLGKDTLLEAMTGGLDGLAPSEAATRLKAAELALRVAERSGLLALLTDEPEAPEEAVDASPLSVRERSRRMREKIAADNARG